MADQDNKTESRDLLIEIGTEELPPGALQTLASAFADAVATGLEKAGLDFGDSQWLATPRRMAVRIRALERRQQDQSVLRRGPAVAAAFDETGTPTRAALGFARSCGVEVQSLQTLETDKGAWLVYQTVQEGQATAELLPEIINSALARLPIPRRMRWGDGDAEFVRPVHWVLILFGAETVACDVLGVAAGNLTRGHRFHHPREIEIRHPGEYEAKLREPGHVLADFNSRKQAITEMVTGAAADLGGVALIDADLLDEITSLVEWPVAVTGSFDRQFLELPAEVLIATMQVHQKYIPVAAIDAVPDAPAGSQPELMPAFITVANIDSPEPEAIRRGNERVIRPRLTDAAFFWQRDRSRKLEDYRPGLKQVVYQKQLGTLADKTDRIRSLAAFVARQLELNVQVAERAAELCKCDLLTDMVGEFPELQGTMGRYYALADGENSEVATALEEQYLPRHAGGQVPGTDNGRVLAIADKLDTLTGIFAIGQAPSGDRDPFGLRRAALGCLRIMIECRLGLNLRLCLESAVEAIGDIVTDSLVDDVYAFMMERLRRYYLDDGIRPDVFDAVLARRPEIPYDFHLRIHAVTAFTKLPEAASLAAANKRISNLLRQVDGQAPETIDTGLLHEPEEKQLFSALTRTSDQISPALKDNDYNTALTILAGMRDEIDAFFDRVMVMCDDKALRDNRLAVLNKLGQLFQAAADISRLQAG